MSAALLHYVNPMQPPVGVWWLAKQRTVPQSYYPDPNSPYYSDAAVRVLGDSYDGQPYTLAHWQYLVDTLPVSANPHGLFVAVEAGKDPRALLRTLPKDLKVVHPS